VVTAGLDISSLAALQRMLPLSFRGLLQTREQSALLFRAEKLRHEAALLRPPL